MERSAMVALLLCWAAVTTGELSNYFTRFCVFSSFCHGQEAVFYDNRSKAPSASNYEWKRLVEPVPTFFHDAKGS